MDWSGPVATLAPMQTCYRHPDRETGLSCSECGRPICTECMTMAPVGLRCPEHSCRPQGVQRVRRAATTGTGALVTKALIAVNVGVFVLSLAQGATVGQAGGELFVDGALYGPAVAAGDWWRLITSTFLHSGIFHLAMNMFILWIVGARLEESMGRSRYLLLYLVGGLAGSAGALLLEPNAVSVGASGSIFGLLGALLVLERQGTYVLGGSVLGLVILNLAITFVVPGISVGGHLGGLAGGALGTLALSSFGRGHALYGRAGIFGTAGLLAVGVLSVAIAYLQV
jgi:membrane associated rhomboid family serine protease